MAKYVTIKDIARELGISKSTVSRALSGDTGNVKAETLQKIMETAEQRFGCTPSTAKHTQHRNHHSRNHHKLLYDLHQ